MNLTNCTTVRAVMVNVPILNHFFLFAGKITDEHISVIWQAAQLNHCSKQVHDLLLPLIKNLEAGPLLSLYEHLKVCQ